MHLTFRLGAIDCALVSPREPAASRLVDKLLCIPDPGADREDAFRLKLWDGLIHFFDTEVQAFPAGLWHRLDMRLRKRGHTVELLHPEQPVQATPVPADYLIGIEMRDYQLEAANAALELRRGLLWIATNGGKTEILSAVIGKLVREGELKVLVIVPNTNLLHQTAARIGKRLGPDVRIGRVGDGLRELQADVLVGTYQSLAPAVPDRRGKTEDAEIAAFIRASGAVMVDETHHAPASSIKTILCYATSAYYRIGCTGTVDKSDKRAASDDAAREHRWKMESYLGPVLYRITNDYLIERGFSAKPHVVVMADRNCFGPVVPTPKMNPFTKVNPYTQVWRRAAIEDRTWCKTIAEVTGALVASGRPPFVFSHSVAHIRAIAEQCRLLDIPHVALDGGDDTPARQDAIRRFSKHKDFAIITSPIFDEGADVPDIRACVLAGARKSCVELLQRVGRGVRKKEGEDNTVLIVDFDPIHSTMLHDHFLSRLATYRDEGFKVSTLGDKMSFHEMLQR